MARTRSRSNRSTAKSSTAVTRVVEGVRRLDRGLRLRARAVERATGLSAAQLFVLAHLREEHAGSLNELARRTMTDRSSVSVVVDRLVAARLVRRTESPDDRRRSEIHLTAAGRATLARAPAAPTDQLIAALRKLPRSAVVALGRSLQRLNRALDFEDSGMLFEDSDAG